MMPNTVLSFLTDEDFKLLEARATIQEHEANHLLLEEGSRRQILYVILEGSVRIEKSHLGQSVVVATREAGEVFGEMSFLDSEPASASVLTQERVRLLVIEPRFIQSLMAS